MTDAFSDFNTNGDVSSNTEDTTTSNDTVTTFSDSVRSTLPSGEEITDDRRYEDEETGEKADEVDPRGLFKQRTINELRYYSREGPYGHAIITKPIDDIFKHGFSVEGDFTERDDGSSVAGDFLKEEYKDTYITAERKSRRDGLCVLMHLIEDNASSVAEPIPVEGGSFSGFKIWTIDTLSDELTDSTVADHTDFTEDQIYVSEGPVNGGVAIVDDINHPDHEEILGYGVKPRQDSDDAQTVQFVHGDRCQHFVWGSHVDGELGNFVTGKHVGESVLTPVLEPLKGAQMGYWAMKNILFRYSAPLHAVEPPESWGIEEWNEAEQDLGDISMASDALLPPGSELSVAEGVSEFDPEPIYDVLVSSVCTGTVFTKSVLQGTQSGTVSGSETDVKGYFNGVTNLRQERTDPKFREILKQVSQYDPQTVPPFTAPDSIDFDWGALLKPTAIQQAEGAVSLVTAATNGIKNYVLTPDEARSLLEEEWTTFDIDVALDDLSEDDWDSLDRINIREAGQGPRDDESVSGEGSVRANPTLQNGGGQPQGQTRESSQPQRSTDELLGSLTDKELQAELDRRADKEE